MAASRKKSGQPRATGTKKGSSVRKSARPKKRGASARGNPIDAALARLERDIPRLLRQLRRNVQDLQRQVARARDDGEKRWQTAERKLKQDANRLRSRLEGAIGRVRGGRRTKPARKSAARKAGAKTRKSSRKRAT